MVGGMNKELIKQAFVEGYKAGMEKDATLKLQDAMKLIRSLEKSDYAATDILNNAIRAMRVSARTGRLTEPTFVNLVHIGRIAKKFDNYMKASRNTISGRTTPFSVMQSATHNLLRPNLPASGAARDLLEEIGYLKPKSKIPIEDAIGAIDPALRIHW